MRVVDLEPNGEASHPNSASHLWRGSHSVSRRHPRRRVHIKASLSCRSNKWVHHSVVRQSHVAVGDAYARGWKNPIRVSSATTDHHFGPGLLMVRCLAGRRPWTGGAVSWTAAPKEAILMDCLEASSMKLVRRESFFCRSFRKAPNILLKVSDHSICFLEWYTVLTGHSWHSHVW